MRKIIAFTQASAIAAIVLTALSIATKGHAQAQQVTPYGMNKRFLQQQAAGSDGVSQATVTRQSLQQLLLQDWNAQAQRFSALPDPTMALDAYFAAPARCLHEHLLPCPAGRQSVYPPQP